MNKRCGTCGDWHYDYTGGTGKDVGLCRNSIILASYLNPFVWADDLVPYGVGRFIDDGENCTEWRGR